MNSISSDSCVWIDFQRIDEIANYLIEKENITGEEFMEIFRKYIPEGTHYDLNNDDVFVSDATLDMASVVSQPVIMAPIKEEAKIFRQLVLRAASEEEISISKASELLDISYLDVLNMINMEA